MLHVSTETAIVVRMRIKTSSGIPCSMFVNIKPRMNTDSESAVALPSCSAESYGEFIYCAEIVKSTWLVSPVRTVTFLAQVFGSL